MKPPSVEGAGGGGVGCAEEPPNQPMVDVLEVCESGCEGGCSSGPIVQSRLGIGCSSVVSDV
jgi:hypothetical protein